MNLEQFAKQTDFKLLGKQKLSILKILNPDEMNFQDPDRMTHLEGILNFLDGFQDAVVDSSVLPEEKVFPVPEVLQ
jgi:hypothetical protein